MRVETILHTVITLFCTIVNQIFLFLHVLEQRKLILEFEIQHKIHQEQIFTFEPLVLSLILFLMTAPYTAIWEPASIRAKISKPI